MTVPGVLSVALFVWLAYAAWIRGNIADTILVWCFVGALAWAASRRGKA